MDNNCEQFYSSNAGIYTYRPTSDSLLLAWLLSAVVDDGYPGHLGAGEDPQRKVRLFYPQVPSQVRQDMGPEVCHRQKPGQGERERRCRSELMVTS